MCLQVSSELTQKLRVSLGEITKGWQRWMGPLPEERTRKQELGNKGKRMSSTNFPKMDMNTSRILSPSIKKHDVETDSPNLGRTLNASLSKTQMCGRSQAQMP